MKNLKDLQHSPVIGVYYNLETKQQTKIKNIPGTDTFITEGKSWDSFTDLRDDTFVIILDTVITLYPENFN